MDLHHRDDPHDLARTLEFHYTPKHGSWLNIAEIELAVLSNMRLTQRIPDKDHLRREIETNVNTLAMPKLLPSIGASPLRVFVANWRVCILVFQRD